MQKYIYILILVFLYSISNANNKDTVELEAIKTQVVDYISINQDYDNAINLCDKGIDLAKELNNKIYEGKFYSYKGLSLLRLEDFVMAKDYLIKAINIYTLTQNYNGLAICYTNLGKSYYSLGDNKNAIICYEYSIAIANKIGRYKSLSNNYTNIALIYSKRGEYIKAIETHQQALTNAKEHNFRVLESQILSNIGNVYNSSGKYKLSNQYYLQSKNISIENNDSILLINLNINIACNYSAMEYYDSALNIYLGMYDYVSRIGTKGQQASLNLNIAAQYLIRDDYQTSLTYSTKAYNISKLISKNSSLVNSCINIAEANYKLNNIAEAKAFLSEGENVAIENEYQYGLRNIYDSYSDLYYFIGDYKQAFDYKELCREINDSINNKEVHEKIEELNIMYQTSEKEKQIALQNITIINQNKDIERRKHITIYSIITIALLLIFISILLLLYFQKQRAFKYLAKQNKEIATQEVQIKKLNKSSPEIINEKSKKYEGSHLSDKQKAEMFNLLNTLMVEEELYTNTKLNIEDIALRLNTNRRYISQLINELTDKNFSSYVNEYRVKKSRQLLLDPKYDKLTIEAIAEMSGFHSRVAFNNSFKKFTGLTPSFLKKNRDN